MVVCCNGDPVDAALTHMLRHHLTRVDTFPMQNVRWSDDENQRSSASASFLSHFKPLSAAQRALAAPVFGNSIDFTSVLLSDFKGASGRAFTIVVGRFLIMNCGSFRPSNAMLIHELVHVWQSQHHADETAYMVNSAQSQAQAVAENEALARVDPSLKGNPGFPSQYPRSAYAFMPGRAFKEYAAEQIAKQVERNFLAPAGSAVAMATAPVVAHIKAAAKGADPDNVTGLKTARAEDKRTPGVLF